MPVVLVDLIIRHLSQNGNQAGNVALVCVGPYIVLVIGRYSLERDEGKQVLFHEELDHLAELKGVAGSGGIIAQAALASA